MKAVQFSAPGKVGLVDIPQPQPPAGEVLVKVRAITTCPQWDMHIYHGEPMFVGRPITYPFPAGQPGHELAGEVAAVGENVSTFRKGQRVVAWRDCGCGNQRTGGYAEYVCLPETALLKLPDNAEFRDYASLELGMCVGGTFLDLNRSTSLAGKIVGVSGLGGAGLLAAQYAKAEGAAEVVGFELDPGRAESAARFGVDRIVDPRQAGDKRYLDVAIDCVGARASIELLLGLTKEIVAIFGVQREPVTFPAMAGNLKLFGMPQHSKPAAEYALAHVTAGRVSLRGLIGAELSLAEYEKGVQLLKKREVIKVCYLPHG